MKNSTYRFCIYIYVYIYNVLYKPHCFHSFLVTCSGHPGDFCWWGWGWPFRSVTHGKISWEIIKESTNIYGTSTIFIHFPGCLHLQLRQKHSGIWRLEKEISHGMKWDVSWVLMHTLFSNKPIFAIPILHRKLSRVLVLVLNGQDQHQKLPRSIW